MGLLDRLRSGRDGQEEPRRADGDDTPALLDPPEKRDVIGPGVYNPAGAWNWAPPMPMVIPEMPLVVPPFEQALISHQLPEPFASGLGHYVSEDAPAGFVEPVAILSDEASVGAEAGPRPAGETYADIEHSAQVAEPLPLAVSAPKPPPSPEEQGPAWAREATLPVVRPQPSEAQSLMAAEPPELPLQPLPSWPLPEEMRAQLEQAAQPEPWAPEPPTFEPPAFEPPTFEPESTVVPPPAGSAPTADLVGGRPLVDPASPVQAPAAGGQPAAVEGQDRLPLAVPPTPAAEPRGREPETTRSDDTEALRATPPPAEAELPEPAAASLLPAEAQTPAGDDSTKARGRLESGPASADTPTADADAPDELPVAPLLGLAAPLVAEPESPSAPLDADAARMSEVRPEDGGMPLVTPPAPAAPSGADEGAGRLGPPTDAGQAVVAPLVGANPAMVPLPPEERPTAQEGDEQDLPLTPPSRSRTGLGTPMHSLPASARSYNLTNLSRSEQLEMARSLMTGGQRTPADLPLARPPQETRPEAEWAPGQLPAARLQPFPAQTADRVAGHDAPVERIAPLVPFNDMTGPAGAREQAEEGVPDEEGAAVRAEVGMRYGLDLAHIPVDRSPQGALEAHFAGARAFTTDSGIVIPPSAGSLKAGEGAALLAHELTHVAQRMGRPGPVPDEASPEGRMLESEARRTEMVYAKGAQLPPWGLEPPATGAGFADAATTVSPSQGLWPAASSLPVVSPQPFGAPNSSPETSWLPLASAGQASGPDTEAIARTVLERVSELMPGPAPYTEVVTPVSAPAPAAMSMQRAEMDSQPSQAAPAPTPEPVGQGTETGMPRPSDEDLSNLSRWLYPLIRYRLKRELREDRERAGLLTDHYRRW